MEKKLSIETVLSHAGLCSDKKSGAISTPIYQSATFSHPKLGESTGFDYSRTSNPTRLELEKTVANLESGAQAFGFSSGMAALSSLLTLFKPGDRIAVSDDLYGGTYRLFEKVFRPWGFEADYFDFSYPEKVFRTGLHAGTRAVFIETPTNPLFKITDLRTVSRLAKSRGMLMIVDNTFMTPYCQRPIELGADIVVHSGTKFLAGHNDTLCGVVVAREKALAEKLAFTQNATGGVLSPFDSWLLLRGVKTLAIRMDRAQENSLQIAKWLLKRKGVTNVYFPGLHSHPGYAVHSRQTSGPGAVLSFRLKKTSTARRIINNVKVITYAESLGGVESLVTYPLTQTHADIPKELRERIGITDTLLRLSTGIENCKDLINDLDQAIG
jgi:cystathionine beta-lyase/cystathionine gamma-synthase